MDLNLEVVFRNMPEMKSIRRHLEKEIQSLDDKFEGIESCKVAFELPYHHRYPGNIYDFNIEVVVPGNKVNVSRSPSADGANADVFSLIRDAFVELEQKLETCACAKEPVSALDQHLIPLKRGRHGDGPHLYRRHGHPRSSEHGERPHMR